MDVAAWDTTQELPVPCFVCVVFDRNARTLYPQRASGSGCHPYRRIALSRAITEALQSRLTFIAGGRDDAYWSFYRDGLRADDEPGRIWAEAEVAEAACLDFEDVPEAPPMTSIDALLKWVLEKLAGIGFGEAIVVDLTQAQIAIPVVHVTVPGAEGVVTQAGYTPGPRMQAVLAERS